ncbi:ketopantoate reductase family protein [Nannocystis bainbridge]|uniref:2-dehydropantoate 2-reductase N-terminal domain-containing protein n=1 Tax=Nannocystis bainbridge TaxID=2995303 RepID=A0ABT5ECE8_9BACT|nr:2-dehydropantoate 2-reductase N-terminal domain-containing protein [Nannocystis bainbridge]MDC0723531.1 2-dehydropantoate 2-reductase N-terminal domain-containing protein [Nannocystis bainbridge]
MKIAILGPGGIGSTFAFQLARAGHDVTVIARGARLAHLEREGAIRKNTGERAVVDVQAALDPETAWDLVLVSVLASQVDAVLPALAASAARTILFMFNTFEPLDRLRDAVGRERAAFGFPAILAWLDDGVLTTSIVTRGPLLTPVSDPAWAPVFTAAGIPTVVEPDMQSWLRTHAAFVVPGMIASIRAYDRRAGLSWTEAKQLARASDEGFRLVRRLGDAIVPAAMVTYGRLPTVATTAILWAMSRVPSIRRTGAAGPGESRTLIDMMTAAAPGDTQTLLAVRP